MQAIIIALITAGIPAIVTIVTTISTRKLSKMHSAKQSILQMIMEDYVMVEHFDMLPRNYTNIHYEYDVYKKNDGNSDIDIKMAEYETWYKALKARKPEEKTEQ